MKIWKRKPVSTILYESKADEERFRKFAGDDLADEFYKLKPRIKPPQNDVYYWMKKDIDELKAFLSDLSSVQTRKEKEDNARQGAEKLYSDQNWDVLKINTFEASKKYGANTKWCITGKESGWIKDGNENKYWREYTDRGIKFYFYIDKKNNTKYAVSVQPNGVYEIFNARDNQIEDIPNKPNVSELPLPYTKTEYINTAIIHVLSINLLSADEIKEIPNSMRRYAAVWWSRSPGNDVGTVLTDIGGGEDKFGQAPVNYPVIAVRPSFVVSDLESINVKIGEEVLLGDNQIKCIVVSNNKLLYNDEVTKSIFDKKTNNYDKSYIKKKVIDVIFKDELGEQTLYY